MSNNGAVLIDKQLVLSDHFLEKIKKPNKIIGLIRSKFVHMNPNIIKLLNTAFVRPYLKYANQMCCPHLIKDVLALGQFHT